MAEVRGFVPTVAYGATQDPTAVADIAGVALKQIAIVCIFLRILQKKPKGKTHKSYFNTHTHTHPCGGSLNNHCAWVATGSISQLERTCRGKIGDNPSLSCIFALQACVMHVSLVRTGGDFAARSLFNLLTATAACLVREVSCCSRVEEQIQCHAFERPRRYPISHEPT